MYKFVRLHSKHCGIDHPWILSCDNVDTMLEHTRQYFFGEIKTGMEDVLDHLQNGYHLSSNWGLAIKVMMESRGEGIVGASSKLEYDILMTKIDMIRNWGGVYLRDSGSYMPFNNDFVVIEEMEMEEMVYPKYTKDQIRIIKWDGGKHYYAKLGKMDIVDDDGNQKWDTEEEARKVAEEYFESLTF